MRPRKPNFGERITNLRLQYGSQKELAESLGVSVRTVRRYENRKAPPKGHGAPENLMQLVKRRERYQRNKTQRIMKDMAEQIKSKKRTGRAAKPYLNELLPRGLYAPQVGGGRQTILPSDYPAVVKQMVSGRETEVTFAVLNRGEPGRVEVYVLPPGDGPGEQEHFLRMNPGAEIVEADIPATRDWTEWERHYWDWFREALGY